MSYINQVQGLVASGAAASGENPLLIAGSNSSNVKILAADASGNLSIVGPGVAGTPSGGVLSIQGVASGTAVPVSGTFFQSTQPVSSTQLPASLGQKASSASLAAVLSSDQSEFSVVASPQVVLNTPTSNSMAAANATVIYQVQAGGSYYLTLTNGPGATTAWVGTVTFQYSTDGSTYNSLNVNPVAAPASSAPTSTATANGLFLIEVPSGVASQIIYIRANMTAYTSGTAYFFVATNQPQQKILMPWTYTVTSGQTVLGPIEASNFSEIDVQISAITTTVITAQGTNDPTLTTFVSLPAISAGTQAASVGTLSAALTYRVMTNGYKWIRLQCTTTGTVLTIQGIAGTVGNNILLTAFGNDMGVTVNAGTLPTVTTVSTVTSMTSGNLAIPGIITDVASAAITTTTTTATLTPTFGPSYSVNIPVTVVSGTTPTLDVQVQESADTGTNWYAVYDFPRITATGSYNSPPLLFTGNRIRYVQTVGGTTPSFTRAINRLQGSSSAPNILRQTMDRTIVLTTLSSTTVSLYTAGSKNAQLIINIGTTTIAPVLQLQGSDDFGATWYSMGSTLTAVASSTVQLTVNNMNAAFIRAIVTTAGTATVAGYVCLKAF